MNMQSSKNNYTINTLLADQLMNKPDCYRSINSGYEILNGNKIHKTAIINWDTVTIGTGNVIFPFVCIGTDAQSTNANSDGKIIVGDNNVFRENSTVHLPTNPECGTVIGNRNYIMANAHIAHDCHLEDDIVMANNAALGGHVHVMKGANLALNSSVHQFQVVGSWSMVGMNSCVSKSAKILPGQTFFGLPAKFIRRNQLALKRHNVNAAQLEAETQRFYQLVR